jgi:hypothetical protein
MRATKNFQSTVLGNVQKGDPIPNNKHGQHLRSIGLAEDDPVQTKTVRQQPEEPPAQEYETKVVKRKPKTKKGAGRGRKRSDKASG